jgi:hypothetical protein
MADVQWTPALVEERLIEAAETMRRMPETRVQGYSNGWPTILREFQDRVGEAAVPLRRPPPSPDAITRMEEALSWLRWLEPDDVKLVWMRAERARWREICGRFAIARATANRRFEYALCVIVWRLSERPLPRKWSRRFLIQRARFVMDAPFEKRSEKCLTQKHRSWNFLLDENGPERVVFRYARERRA